MNLPEKTAADFTKYGELKKTRRTMTSDPAHQIKDNWKWKFYLAICGVIVVIGGAGGLAV